MSKLPAAKEVLAETKKIKQKADDDYKASLMIQANTLRDQLPILIKDAVKRGHDFVLVNGYSDDMFTVFKSIHGAELEDQGYKIICWEKADMYCLTISWEGA